VRNLKITVHPDGSAFITGSLPKFISGSNVGTATYELVVEALAALESTFGLDPTFTWVRRLDIAGTMTLSKPPPSYYHTLGDCPRLTRTTYRTGLMWPSRRHTLLVYDKGTEAKVASNLLRFEVQLKKDLSRQLGQTIALGDLKDPVLYSRLVNLWASRYESITKVRSQTLEPTHLPSEMRGQLARIGVESAGGMATLRSQISTWPVTAGQRCRLRKIVKELCQSGNSEHDKALIEELDRAVEKERKNALAQVAGHLV